jgi:hypothetical protein
MIKLRRIVDDVSERQHNGKRFRRQDKHLLRTIIINLLSLLAFFTATGAAATTHEYVVTLAEDLRQIEVVAQFGAVVTDVSARSRSATEFLISAHDCGRDNALPVTPLLTIPGDGIRCLAYRVDIEKAARLDKRHNQGDAKTLILRIPLWMWRPRLGGADDVIVSFKLPQGVDVSVPWQPLPGRDHAFRFTSSPQSGSAISIFGEFAAETVRVANADLRIVSVPSRANPISPEHVEWTRETAEHITLAYGRFPNPYARVLLLPSANRRGESAVQFGRVVRDGGETIELMIDPTKPEESFLGDWTATHEFSHLMLPYVNRDERWISEGFAQYYQNILLARAGRYTQQIAWQKLNSGLTRGRESAPALSPNEAAAGDARNTRMKVYWSGAALALLADVELRRRSGGKESLDHVLGRFQSCCLPSRRTWTGMELFEKFDTLIDEPLFVNLYQRYADSAGFPAFRPLLDQLGIIVAGKDVRLADDAELVEIRESLTARRYTGESGK